MSNIATTHARTVRGAKDLQASVGAELGISSWHQVTQSDIDTFARTTGDFHWVHVDAERAARGPMGKTIAHGLYTLCLGPRFMEEIVRWEGLGLMLNYGYDRIRFPAPLPVGSRVRMRMKLETVTATADGHQLGLGSVFDCDCAERPVCVALWVLRFIGSTGQA
jgi:acyl dehydratase